MEVKVMEAIENDHDHEATKLNEAIHHSPTGSTVKLRRELGLFSAVNLILGVMIGSGIFVSPATALEHAGSVGFCLVVWTISGVVSLLGALSFAELGTVVGKSGAEYSYFQEAFGGLHKFWGPVPSFICAWVYVVILRPAEVAVIVMTFAEYAIQPFVMTVQSDYKDVAIKLTSLCALVTMVEGSSEATTRVLRDLKRQKEEIQEGLRELRNVATDNDCDVEVEAFRDGYREALRGEVDEYLNKIDELDTVKSVMEFNIQIEQTIRKLEEYLLNEQSYVMQLQNSTKSLEDRIAYTKKALKRIEEDDGSADKQITLQQVELARKKVFRVIKEAMQRVIKAHFVEHTDNVLLVLKELLHENGTNKEYIKITKKNFAIVRSLQSMHIVSENPYDSTEIKLSFD